MCSIYIINRGTVPLFFIDTNRKHNKINTFIMFWFILAILLMGIHGDFTADFNSYRRIFYQYSTMILKILYPY